MHLLLPLTLLLSLYLTLAIAATEYQLKTAAIDFKSTTSRMYEFGEALKSFESGCGIPVPSVVQAASPKDVSLYQLYTLIPLANAGTPACTTEFSNKLKAFVTIKQDLRVSPSTYDVPACTVPNAEGIPTTMKCASANPTQCGGLLCYLGASCETQSQCQIGTCENNICFNSSRGIFNGALISIVVLVAVFIGM